VSRTAYYKLHYFGFLIGLPVALLMAVAFFHLSQDWITVPIVLLVIPGRILAYFWDDLLQGLRLLNEKNFEESIRHTEKFLAALERRPWIRHAIWLGTSSYSRNPKSLAYNNLGAAELSLGRLEAARTHLHDAIREDDLNPLPFHNLSLVANKEGNQEEAILMRAAAAARGLTFGKSDQIVMASQKRVAARSGNAI
jgi:tetratricopeptide (TPR) repeat protein